MEIRRATPDQWELGRDIRLAMVADAPDSFGSQNIDALRAEPDQHWRDYHQRHCDVGGKFFAFDGEKLVGTMRLEAPDDVAELCSVWVDPAARGTGAADALISAVLERARERGFERIHLWVTNTSHAARGLYARHGFVETGDTQAHANPDLFELKMERAL